MALHACAIQARAPVHVHLTTEYVQPALSLEEEPCAAAVLLVGGEWRRRRRRHGVTARPPADRTGRRGGGQRLQLRSVGVGGSAECRAAASSSQQQMHTSCLWR